MTTSPQERGLRRLTPEKRREIARLGGLAAQRARTAHRWTAAEASAASLKGWARRANHDPSPAPPPATSISQPAPAAAAAEVSRTPLSATSWTLTGRDGRILQCHTEMVPGGFELCISESGAPLMYSGVYSEPGEARHMLFAWLEAALANGNFAPVGRSPESHDDVA
jgi:hypothetical protein